MIIYLFKIHLLKGQFTKMLLSIKICSSSSKSRLRAREMAQQLIALAALAEDLGSVAITYMAAYSHL